MDSKTSAWETEPVVRRLWHRENSPVNSYFFVQISYNGALAGRSLRSIDTIVRLHSTACVTKLSSLPLGRSTDHEFSSWNCCFVSEKARYLELCLRFPQPPSYVRAMAVLQHRPRQVNVFLIHHSWTSNDAIWQMNLIKHCKIRHRWKSPYNKSR